MSKGADLLSLSRHERRGIIAALLIIAMVMAITSWWQHAENAKIYQIAPTADAAIEQTLEKSQDSVSASRSATHTDKTSKQKQKKRSRHRPSKEAPSHEPARLEPVPQF